MNGYKAFYKGRELEVQADTLYKAQLEAVDAATEWRTRPLENGFYGRVGRVREDLAQLAASREENGDLRAIHADDVATHNQLIAERDEALALYNKTMSKWLDANGQLAASQERERVLREAARDVFCNAKSAPGNKAIVPKKLIFALESAMLAAAPVAEAKEGLANV